MFIIMIKETCSIIKYFLSSLLPANIVFLKNSQFAKSYSSKTIICPKYNRNCQQR